MQPKNWRELVVKTVELAVSEVFGAVTMDPDAKKMWRSALHHSAVGLEMGIAVAIGFGVGWWLDDKFGTKPYLMIVMVVFGVAAGFKGLYRVAKEGLREAEKEDESTSRENGNDS